jgi:hypothetical protein
MSIIREIFAVTSFNLMKIKICQLSHSHLTVLIVIIRVYIDECRLIRLADKSWLKVLFVNFL